MSHFVEVLIHTGSTDAERVAWAPNICSAIEHDRDLDALARGNALRYATQLVRPYQNCGLVTRMGPWNPNLPAGEYIGLCRVRFQGREYTATARDVIPFVDQLRKLGAIVDGEVGEHEYRPGTRHPDYANLASRFVYNHVARSEKDALVRGRTRLEKNAALPRSTHLHLPSARELDREVGTLNQKQAFTAVRQFLEVVASFLLGRDEIESVCYVTAFNVNAFEVTRRASGKGVPQSAVAEGRLAYSVVAEDTDSKRALAYHLQELLPSATSTPCGRNGRNWRQIVFQDFRNKVMKSRIDIKEQDWPTVYYLT